MAGRKRAVESQPDNIAALISKIRTLAGSLERDMPTVTREFENTGDKAATVTQLQGLEDALKTLARITHSMTEVVRPVRAVREREAALLAQIAELKKQNGSPSKAKDRPSGVLGVSKPPGKEAASPREPVAA